MKPEWRRWSRHVIDWVTLRFVGGRILDLVRNVGHLNLELQTKFPASNDKKQLFLFFEKITDIYTNFSIYRSQTFDQL